MRPRWPKRIGSVKPASVSGEQIVVDFACYAAETRPFHKTLNAQIRALGGTKTVASRYGVSQRTVQRWNAGKAKPTNVDPAQLRTDTRDDPEARARGLSPRRKARLGNSPTRIDFRGMAGPPAPAPCVSNGVRWQVLAGTHYVNPEHLGGIVDTWGAGGSGEDFRRGLSGAFASDYMGEYDELDWSFGDADEIDQLDFRRSSAHPREG